MKKLGIAVLLSSVFAGPLLGYVFTVHNNTDTPMEVHLIEALDKDVRKTVPPFSKEEIHTREGGTCTREIKAIGVAANDGKDAQRTALGLEAKHKFSGEFGTCSGKEIFINYTAPAPVEGGVNVTVDMFGNQSAQPSVAGRGSIEIVSE
ncbi:MAG: hypothetical protein AMXMBFR12_02770 [Candidatus Babeliales bacterium]